MNANPKSWNDLEASIANMQTNIDAYYRGNLFSYCVIAVELRKLLCDTQGGTDNSLLKRFYPDPRLHPLRGDSGLINEHTVLYIPFGIDLDGKGGSNVNDVFDESATALPLDDWLAQKLFDNSTTLKNFIRSVSDKEGAHSDLAYNAILEKTKSVFITNDSLAAKTTVAIGCFLIKRLAIDAVNNNIAQISEFISVNYNKVGRGIAILSLREFASRISQGVSLIYESASSVEKRYASDSSKLELIQQTLQAYDPSDFFIIHIIDFNGGIWAYQQTMKS